MIVENLSALSQVRRRCVAGRAQLSGAGALAIGGFGGSRCGFGADAVGYINIMVWVLNGRFAISSPQPRQKLRKLKQSCLAHRHNTTGAEEILHPRKTAAPEHALASAAQRLRPNPDFTH